MFFSDDRAKVNTNIGFCIYWLSGIGSTSSGACEYNGSRRVTAELEFLYGASNDIIRDLAFYGVAIRLVQIALALLVT